MTSEDYFRDYVQMLQGRIEADFIVDPNQYKIWHTQIQPLYTDMSGSPEAYTVELKRPSGPRTFCMRVLPGARKGLPLLVISPGYAGALRDPPEKLQIHFTTIFLSPLGYGTADGGQANELREYGIWPVLANTVHGDPEGYTQWLLDAAYGISWVYQKEAVDCSRKVFAGCSQGGAMSIILGYLYRDTCMAICSDEPFLVDCSGERIHDFIATVVHDPYQIISLSEAEKNLATVDPLRYAPLLNGIPVLICSGTEDKQCPAMYNEKLYHALPKSPYNRYVVHKGRVHGYSSWFHETMMQFLRGELA